MWAWEQAAAQKDKLTKRDPVQYRAVTQPGITAMCRAPYCGLPTSRFHRGFTAQMPWPWRYYSSGEARPAIVKPKFDARAQTPWFRPGPRRFCGIPISNGSPSQARLRFRLIRQRTRALVAREKPAFWKPLLEDLTCSAPILASCRLRVCLKIPSQQRHKNWAGPHGRTGSRLATRHIDGLTRTLLHRLHSCAAIPKAGSD